MADGITIDASEFKTLARDIGLAANVIYAAERAVVVKALVNIKKDTRQAISTSPSWRHLAGTVNYEITALSGKVGYDDIGQGELAGIAEFGSSRHAPHPALMPAFNTEAPRFEKAAVDVAVAIFEKAL
jgi:hypothetical protein